MGSFGERYLRSRNVNTFHLSPATKRCVSLLSFWEGQQNREVRNSIGLFEISLQFCLSNGRHFRLGPKDHWVSKAARPQGSRQEKDLGVSIFLTSAAHDNWMPFVHGLIFVEVFLRSLSPWDRHQPTKRHPDASGGSYGGIVWYYRSDF